MVNRIKVLVTDANFKHTLAAVRALGNHGVEVDTVSHFRKSISFYSKYCRRHFICSNPHDENGFISDMIRMVKKGNYDVLLPIGFRSCVNISKNLESFNPYIKIPIVDFESMEIASDKNKTIKFAIKNNIPTPKTIYPKSLDEIDEISRSMTYPVVIKALQESGSVKYANSGKELREIYCQECNLYKSQVLKGNFPQIQEYIPGGGYGFYALFNHGKPRAIFMHKRIHEYPLTGGPSTMAISYFDPKLKESGLKVLKKLNWHGVAMVEFKKDSRDNKFKLIEINPKFWGSLDLSIISGINFPYLACKMCVDGDIEPIFDYKKNVVFRWIFSDFMYSLANRSIGSFLFDFFNNRIKDDMFLDDMKPFISQFVPTVLSIFLGIKDKNFCYPHGKPELTL